MNEAMQLTKQQETEIWQVYNTWLTAYLNADVKTYDAYFDDDYHFIGSTSNEEFLNRNDTTNFFERTGEQFAGITDLRNETKILEAFDTSIFLTHFFDAWFLSNNDWTYYGRFRFSSVMKKRNHGWRFIYQHFSMPDSKSDEGETIGFDKVNAENIELKDAIKRRTIELEQKNRELEIEAALERVRAQTMAMHSSQDVGKCVVKMFAELTALGVDEGTRFGIGILNHENENNQLWTAKKDGDEVRMHIGNLDMSSHPLLKSARRAWKAQIPIHKYVLEGEELLDYYWMLNTAPDYKIQIPIETLPKKEIQHCFIFEHGFFYAFTPHEFQPDLIQITKRFSSLFEQTYRRYLDLVKAESQAREAQIEAALERVRSRSMAMHKSEDLKDVIRVVFEQMLHLNFKIDSASFGLNYQENDDFNLYTATPEQTYPVLIHIPYFDHPIFNNLKEAKKNRVEFFCV
jgi:ketosteroid isomerase-like protein